MSPKDRDRPVRIANCSGFFGDRLSAAREMVEGGPIDVLTGDWLAELTMLILARQRMKHGEGSGWARTFLTQMEQVLGSCLDRGIRVVSNAGGLDPAGAAAALREKADELGLSQVKIACVSGDDLMPRWAELTESGEPWINVDTGERLSELGFSPLTANAYLGARPITAALAAGADVVITGRVTDAALTIGPAAWWHGWSYDDALAGNQEALDALAGALVAGHVIECGAQATGGNYAFFTEIPDLVRVGFPLAEVAADGGSVITKHAGTGGAVSTGTVTAQLLYEIGGAAYLNPDVTARFDTIQLTQQGPDRVEIGPVRGESPPERLKVALNTLGGFRNTADLVMTGLDFEAKADLALRTITGLSIDQARELASDPRAAAAASDLEVRELDIQLNRHHHPNPPTLAEAQSHVRITVKDSDPRRVGKPFTTRVIESALASYPGMFATSPPAAGTPFGVYWPTTVSPEHVRVSVEIDGVPLPETDVNSPGRPAGSVATESVSLPESERHTDDGPTAGYQGAVAHVPLGAIVGARSGDKGGSANIGIWIPESPEDWAELRWQWLANWLTAERIRDLLPEAAELPIDLHSFPNLRAVNVVIHGLLGRGVAESSRLDPQAKGLGEQLRARLVEIPAELVPNSALPLAEEPM
ncbi:MAG: acyclic terpene utilization AtuA family protein [Candidatus Nanopelagicales bacterium]|nr:acyclic terpene utilization AtuA family protein [Candidatus Nanopelagicales bacterium]